MVSKWIPFIADLQIGDKTKTAAMLYPDGTLWVDWPAIEQMAKIQPLTAENRAEVIHLMLAIRDGRYNDKDPNNEGDDMSKNDKELHAMMVCRTAISVLTYEERMRVVQYLATWTQDQRPDQMERGAQLHSLNGMRRN